MIIADLHIHSRYSRATARNLDPEHLWLAAQRKGIDLLGTGDLTHPAWLEELAEKLVPTGDGAYELRPELAAALADQVPGPCQRPVRFIPSGEISSIYKRGGKTRKVHSLILLPDWRAAARLNQRLLNLGGNLSSDGRPILGLDARDLLEITLEADPSAIFIPAHIWTPWFSLFGSKSGFDAIEECFADLTGHITALETGLSSDPAMNWRLSALDGYALVSHSDAHSPAKLAREADMLTCPPTYPDLAAALAQPAGPGLAGTLEFFPHEGKYHLDGHRKCAVRLEPDETRELGGRCPVCGGLLTVGVLSRVEDLADRPPGQRPAGAKDFESLIPLDEVVGEVLQRGPATKGVRQALERLLETLGPELYILRQAPLEDLARAGGPLLAEAISRMRAGQVVLEGGFDGQFGKVGIFAPGEVQRLAGQKGFWKPDPAPPAAQPAPPRPQRSAPAAPPDPPPLLAPLEPAREGLDPEQAAAVAHDQGHLVVRAGPGSGKTRVLVSRAAALLAGGLDPARLLLITFTRKAAGEMAQRLAELTPRAAGVRVCTFHALGREILADLPGGPPLLLEPEERQDLVAQVAQDHALTPGDLDLIITRLKQNIDAVPAPQEQPAWQAYQSALAQRQVLDLDDLVRQAVLSLRQDPALAAAWRARFAQILVDEYQDVNPAQVALLHHLVSPAASLMAIGDPDQAIYAFRGADPSRFARFAQDFPGAAQLTLSRNYRSTPAILNAAGDLIAPLADPSRLPPIPMAPPGPRPQYCELAHPEAEARWVAAQVVDLLGGLDSRQIEAGAGEGAYGAHQIAVLYRLHAQAPVLAKALAQAGVPVQVAAQAPLAETDPLDFKAQRVTLLSMHAAKGLEWPVVFVTGLEQGLLPYEPPNRPPATLDEERRLLFVALTRAREQLFLSRCRRRTLYGQTHNPPPSPLLNSINPQHLQRVLPAPRRAFQMRLFG